MAHTLVKLEASYLIEPSDEVCEDLKERLHTLGIEVVALISCKGGKAIVTVSGEFDSQTVVAWSVPLLEKKYNLTIEEITVKLPDPVE